MMPVAIIPARGGSTRIPRKNIKLIDELPAIAHTIKILLETNLFSDILVTSDDDEILEISKKYGASSLRKRSLDLSGNQIPTIPVIQDALFSKSYPPITPVCTIYPVNPLIFKETLAWTLKIHLAHPEANYVSTIVRYGFPTQRSLSLNGKFARMNDPKFEWAMSQDLQPTFHETGQFWWGKASTWLRGIPMQESLIGLELPEICQQDVDNPNDWDLMKLKFEYLSDPVNREICLQSIPKLGMNGILMRDSGISFDE